MNKNTIIGFILIAVVLIGFSWYNSPSQEQIEAARQQDSIVLLNCYDGVFISLIVLCLPININLLNYFSILVLFLLLINLFKVKSINYYCLFKLIIVVSMLILNYYNYQNIYETNVETALTTLDLFMGRSIVGIGTTSSFWIIIGYLIMLTIPAFKKDIPVTCIITYFIMMLFGLFFSHNIINDVKMLFTSETLFGFVFISTIPMFSPIEKNNKKIYAITIGILTYLLNYLVNPYEGVFISILLTNLFCAIKDKLGIDFFNKKIYN